MYLQRINESTWIISIFANKFSFQDMYNLVIITLIVTDNIERVDAENKKILREVE